MPRRPDAREAPGRAGPDPAPKPAPGPKWEELHTRATFHLPSQLLQALGEESARGEQRNEKSR